MVKQVIVCWGTFVVAVSEGNVVTTMSTKKTMHGSVTLRESKSRCEALVWCLITVTIEHQCFIIIDIACSMYWDDFMV